MEGISLGNIGNCCDTHHHGVNAPRQKGEDPQAAADEISAQEPPPLVIWGEDDKIIPAGHAGNVEGADVWVLEGAGHMVQMEKAGQVNALILEHILKQADA